MLRRLIVGTPLEPLARRLYRLVKGPAPAAFRQERDVKLALLRLRAALSRDACCVDIGAHQGEWLDYFADLCPQGRHIAFEPLPGLVEGLRGAYPSVEIHQCALSDHPGTTEFVHAVNREAWSGLREQHYPDGTETVRIPVELKTLDGVLAGRDVRFVKIDVEGAELLALSGGRETLARCRPLVYFEFARLHAEPYGVTPAQMVDFFEGLGMRVTALDGTVLDAAALDARFAAAHASDYGRTAETNFLAEPAD